MSTPNTIPSGPSTARLCAYSLASIPLAMAALPIYVNVPKFYATTLGLSLAAIGAYLLVARIFDAVQDPLLGYWSDRSRESRFGRAIWLWIGAPLLAIGMIGLFNPPDFAVGHMAWWLLASLLLVYTAFSMLQISYQAMGAELTANPLERTRVTAFREGFGLLGVFLAAAMPQILVDHLGAREGYAAFAFVFAPTVLLLVFATILLSPPPQTSATPAAASPDRAKAGAFAQMSLPFANLRFRKLMLVFVFNGIAAAIPATLVLFFIQDVIAAPAKAAAFLIVYFAAGALGMPYWTWLSARIGKGRAWFVGMIVSIIAFVWAFTLTTGDTTEFFVICALSGLGLGADLALPPSILADVIDDDEARGLGRNEGAYFGIWNLLTKMNLALAAGIALPVLAWLGYQPGMENSGKALKVLAGTYALLPCGLKGIAAILLMQTYFIDNKETGA